ncbi:hypothetical protein SCUCBS95973_001162 [Sporothrix curviconia]|uniref:Ig-like domain-containing protein n=1 Tax=Sporothrix curviconia TaxID=1260050 RepID=A0ABP0AWF9_9PEZI
MVSHSVLLLASPAAVMLASAQVGPYQSPIIAGCTTSSFSVPSWWVHNLTTTASSASFHVVNRATNDSAKVTCSAAAAASSGWQACSFSKTSPANLTISGSVHLNSTTAHLSLNQTWTCNDRKSPPVSVTFTAVGRQSASLKCTGGNKNQTATPSSSCTAADNLLLVRGSLLAPVAITPAYSEGPTGHDKPGCAANSKMPHWSLADISYTDRTGDGISAMARQDFIAQIVNTATGYEAGCSANYGVGGGPAPAAPGTSAGGLSFNSTALHVGCTGTEFGSPAFGKYTPRTDASFDPITNVFTVNQTWFCDDEDEAKPVQITAVGRAKLPLTCEATHTPGAGDEAGQTTKQCVPSAALANTNSTGRPGSHVPAITVQGRVTHTEPLPPYSIEEPQPVPDGCTVSSLLNPVWMFSAFGYDKKNNATSAVENVSFDLILQTGNPGFQFPISITQGKHSGNSSSWYTCVIGNGGDDSPTLWPYACQFQYVPATKQLSLKANWYCSDIDAKHPVAFSGDAVTTVNKAVSCAPASRNGVVNKDGLQTCVAKDSSDSWTAPITNVAWKSA